MRSSFRSPRDLFRQLVAGLAFAVAMIAASSSGRAQDYDLSRDFDTNSNPSGVWAYGWKNALGTFFNPVTFVGRGFADNGVPFDAWSIEQLVLPAFYHYPL